MTLESIKRIDKIVMSGGRALLLGLVIGMVTAKAGLTNGFLVGGLFLLWLINDNLVGIKNSTNTERIATKLETSKELFRPSVELAKIVGSEPISHTQVIENLWSYIKKNNLQDKNKNINTDENLLPILGKSQVSMYEMTKLVSKHLSK